MLKSVIKPVRTKILVFDIVFAFTWTFLECYFVTLLSRMTGEAFYGNESANLLVELSQLIRKGDIEIIIKQNSI